MTAVMMAMFHGCCFVVTLDHGQMGHEQLCHKVGELTHGYSWYVL